MPGRIAGSSYRSALAEFNLSVLPLLYVATVLAVHAPDAALCPPPASAMPFPRLQIPGLFTFYIHVFPKRFEDIHSLTAYENTAWLFCKRFRIAPDSIDTLTNVILGCCEGKTHIAGTRCTECIAWDNNDTLFGEQIHSKIICSHTCP